jgi:hypothetical protein
MAAFWAVFIFGGSGPAITAHGSLDLKQEIQIQMLVRLTRCSGLRRPITLAEQDLLFCLLLVMGKIGSFTVIAFLTSVTIRSFVYQVQCL